MARNINRKLLLSDGAKASIVEDVLSISGAKGELSLNVHDTVKVSIEEDSVLFNPKDLEDKTSAIDNKMLGFVNMGIESKSYFSRFIDFASATLIRELNF